MPTQKPHLHYLLFYVTSRCNLRCKHCFYLDELNQHDEMTLDEIQSLAQNLNPLRFLRITGGEPFLRKDIPNVIKAFYTLADTKRMGLITNGTRPDWIEEKTAETMEHCPNLKLDIGVSLDGPEEIHDEIRGLKGSYAKAKESAQRLIHLKSRYPRLSTSLVTTITSKNEPVLEDFYKDIASWGVDRLSVNHIRGKVHDESLKEINYKTYLDFAERCEAYHHCRDLSWKATVQRAKNRLTRKAIEQIVDGQKTTIPCLAGSSIGVLYSDGELYLCEMLDSELQATETASNAHARIGNVREVNGNFYDLWHSEATQRCRDWIQDTNCSCSHECFLTASILFGKGNYPALAKEWLNTLMF